MGVSTFAWTVALLLSIARQDDAQDFAPSHHIVLFAPGIASQGRGPGDDMAMRAQKTCLRHGCRVRQVYRLLPGMAIEGGRIGGIRRDPEIRQVYPDARVHFTPDASPVMGAPPSSLLAYIGPALDRERLQVERTSDFLSETTVSPALREAATQLVEAYAHRSSNARLWSLRVVGVTGAGRLSDVLAAVDILWRDRRSVGATYIPLAVTGSDLSLLCAFFDAALSQGMLLLTSMDAACPVLSVPSLPHR